MMKQKRTLPIILAAGALLFFGLGAGTVHWVSSGAAADQSAEEARFQPTQYQPVSGQRETYDTNNNRDSGSRTTEAAPPAAPAVPPGAPGSFRSVAQAVLPVVVEVTTVEVVKQQIPNFGSPFEFFFGDPRGDDEEPEEREFRRPGLGSGVIVRHEGNKVYVLTNNHVVGEADEISVTLADGREFEAETVGKDARTDLALIRFNTREEIPVATLGNSDDLYIGDWVLAVGNPYGFESTVTAGIVSALKRRADQAGLANFTDYIQTDASINPGNSGGALANLKGEIIGINTWIASRDGGNVGLGFAIPINNAKKVIDDFIRSGKVEYGWLGVSIGEVSEEMADHLSEHWNFPAGTQGAFVNNLYTDSPAAKAGVRAGDFITRVDGETVKDYNHLARIIGTKSPGARVALTLIRNGQTLELTVNLTAREQDSQRTNENLWPGFTAIPLEEEVREQLNLDKGTEGVVVTGVAQGSPASAARLQQGDVILSIDDTDVSDLGDFFRLMGEEKREYRLRVTREGQKGLILLER